jgi:hypothetical protein
MPTDAPLPSPILPSPSPPSPLPMPPPTVPLYRPSSLLQRPTPRACASSGFPSFLRTCRLRWRLLLRLVVEEDRYPPSSDSAHLQQPSRHPLKNPPIRSKQHDSGSKAVALLRAAPQPLVVPRLSLSSLLSPHTPFPTPPRQPPTPLYPFLRLPSPLPNQSSLPRNSPSPDPKQPPSVPSSLPLKPRERPRRRHAKL